MQPEVGGTAQGTERRSTLGLEDVGIPWEPITWRTSIIHRRERWRCGGLSACPGGGGAGQCFWEREACSGVQEEEKRGSRCPLRGEGRVVARTAGAVPGVGARVGAGGRFCGWLVWCWYFVTRLRGNKKRCTPS